MKIEETLASAIAAIPQYLQTVRAAWRPATDLGSAASRPSSLLPPYTFLVISTFAAFFSFRVFAGVFLSSDPSPGKNFKVFNQLAQQLTELSVDKLILIALPVVLLVTGWSWLIAVVLNKISREDVDQRYFCETLAYFGGYQHGVFALFALTLAVILLFLPYVADLVALAFIFAAPVAVYFLPAGHILFFGNRLFPGSSSKVILMGMAMLLLFIGVNPLLPGFVAIGPDFIKDQQAKLIEDYERKIIFDSKSIDCSIVYIDSKIEDISNKNRWEYNKQYTINFKVLLHNTTRNIYFIYRSAKIQWPEDGLFSFTKAKVEAVRWGAMEEHGLLLRPNDVALVSLTASWIDSNVAMDVFMQDKGLKELQLPFKLLFEADGIQERGGIEHGNIPTQQIQFYVQKDGGVTSRP